MEKEKAFIIQSQVDGKEYTRYFTPISTDSGTWWVITSLKISEKNPNVIVTLSLTILKVLHLKPIGYP